MTEQGASQRKLRIAVAGLGYVGLAQACLLAQQHSVIAYDISAERVEKVKAGQAPFADADIAAALADGQLELTATTDAAEAFTGADYVVIATPTDFREPGRDGSNDGRSATGNFDTSSIEQVLAEVQKFCPAACVVLKSTVYIGYTEDVSRSFNGLKLLVSPEFLREGQALHDNLNPSRIIVGYPTLRPELEAQAQHFADLLQACANNPAAVPTMVVWASEAEAIKLFSNDYLAMRVAFFIELDTYAELYGLHTPAIIRGVCLDPRIHDEYNNPSFGYGGYCLPKDSKQLAAQFGDEVPQRLISAIVQANATRIQHIAEQIIEHQVQTVGVYRLTMKSGSDNFRQSSVLEVMRLLLDEGLELLVYEPHLNDTEFSALLLQCGMAQATLQNDLAQFKQACDLIISNRNHPELADVANRLYTRDITGRD
ncbi:MAG: nucleotide sugar dehydrogenase [Coriobacteriales bacterium]|nr:nucleotide sugar dehydrogenase [Coriobacteriales bacterium]